MFEQWYRQSQNPKCLECNAYIKSFKDRAGGIQCIGNASAEHPSCFVKRYSRKGNK